MALKETKRNFQNYHNSVVFELFVGVMFLFEFIFHVCRRIVHGSQLSKFGPQHCCCWIGSIDGQQVSGAQGVKEIVTREEQQSAVEDLYNCFCFFI